MKTDFVMVEECNMYEECQEYIDAYGIEKVVAIEYNKGAFTKGCNQYPKLTLVFRDQNLVAKGEEGYQFSLCGASSKAQKLISSAAVLLMILFIAVY